MPSHETEQLLRKLDELVRRADELRVADDVVERAIEKLNRLGGQAPVARPLTHVYAVTVPPDVSEEPIRWLFFDQSDADAFAAACNGGRDSEYQEAVVTYEPVAYSLTDDTLRNAYPEETADANRMIRGDAA